MRPFRQIIFKFMCLSIKCMHMCLPIRHKLDKDTEESVRLHIFSFLTKVEKYVFIRYIHRGVSHQQLIKLNHGILVKVRRLFTEHIVIVFDRSTLKIGNGQEIASQQDQLPTCMSAFMCNDRSISYV